MALHYILDGYNVIKQNEDFAALDLENGRFSLIQFIENTKPYGSLRNRVTIVFDGQAGFESKYRSKSCQIVFSVYGKADDYIKQLVSQAKNRSCIVVVTNDRAIRYFVKALGAKVLGTSEFLLKSEKKKSASVGSDVKKKQLSKKVTRVLESKINAEFEEIWLKKKGNHENSF